MSSDCFEVRVAKVSGTEVVLDVLTSTAGGLNDYAKSRSFALLCLEDALQRATDLVPHDWDEEKRDAEVQRLYRKHEQTALHKALPSTDGSDWYISEAWMKENVGRFIASCDLVERRNDLPDEELRKREIAIEEKFGALYTDKHHLWQPMRWKDCHNFTLRVVVTDPKWAAHLEPGLCFGTTAYDVWWEG